MTRGFRRIVWVGLFAAATLTLPGEALAQRHPPARGGHPASAPPAHVAVPRAHPPATYHPYYRGPYYRPYYPYYRPYYPYYGYPYYYSPWRFSIGIGFGIGGYWGAYGSWYGYPYYPYYAYPPPYPYYSYPYPPAGYDSQPAAPGDTTYAGPPAANRGDRSGFGTLSLLVIPSDAAILVDGQPWEIPRGDDRVSIELIEGPHRVEVRKEGFAPYVRTIDVPRGRTMLWNVSLSAGGGSIQVGRTVPLVGR